MRDARQNEVDKVVETSLTRCVSTGERLQCKALYSYVRCCRRETLSTGHRPVEVPVALAQALAGQ